MIWDVACLAFTWFISIHSKRWNWSHLEFTCVSDWPFQSVDKKWSSPPNVDTTRQPAFASLKWRGHNKIEEICLTKNFRPSKIHKECSWKNDVPQKRTIRDFLMSIPVRDFLMSIPVKLIWMIELDQNEMSASSNLHIAICPSISYFQI